MSEALFCAASTGDLASLGTALNQNPELATAVNPQGVSLLMWAKYHRQSDTAKLIYSHVTNPTAAEAVAMGDDSTLLYQLQKNPTQVYDYSSDGFTLLHYACFFAHPACVKLLLAKHGEVNCTAKNPSKVFPIHSAAAAQCSEIIAMLLAAGANPDVQQTGGFTPLMSAAIHNNIDLVRLLLVNGADKNVREDNGLTAYQLGIDKGFDIALLQ